MHSAADNSRSSQTRSPGSRKRGHPQCDRRIRIIPERLDHIDYRKLARALLRLAQTEYDAAPTVQQEQWAASHVEPSIPAHQTESSTRTGDGHRDETGDRAQSDNA